MESERGGPTRRSSHAEPHALSPLHRVILAQLRARGGEATVGQLARDLAARRQNQPPGTVSPAATRRVYRELTSGPLATLAEQGLIDRSEQTGSVRLRG